MLTPTYDTPSSFSSAATAWMSSVPFVERTVRIPRLCARSTSSGRSARSRGSPPLKRMTGAPNAARSSITAFASAVVSSPS